MLGTDDEGYVVNRLVFMDGELFFLDRKNHEAIVPLINTDESPRPKSNFLCIFIIIIFLNLRSVIFPLHRL